MIRRIERAFSRYGERFLRRFLCESERNILAQKAFAPRSIAGFWAAKEACAKALGLGIGHHLRFTDMRLSYTQANAPILTLDANKCVEFGIKSLGVSISHDGGIAIAVVAVAFK